MWCVFSLVYTDMIEMNNKMPLNMNSYFRWMAYVCGFRVTMTKDFPRSGEEAPESWELLLSPHATTIWKYNVENNINEMWGEDIKTIYTNYSRRHVIVSIQGARIVRTRKSPFSVYSHLLFFYTFQRWIYGIKKVSSGEEAL